jgi:hypothetical protein
MDWVGLAQGRDGGDGRGEASAAEGAGGPEASSLRVPRRLALSFIDAVAVICMWFLDCSFFAVPLCVIAVDRGIIR